MGFWWKILRLRCRELLQNICFEMIFQYISYDIFWFLAAEGSTSGCEGSSKSLTSVSATSRFVENSPFKTRETQEIRGIFCWSFSTIYIYIDMI